MVRGRLVGSIRYSTEGSLGLIRSVADSKNVVRGGAERPSISSASSCPVVTFDFDEAAEFDAEESPTFNVWLL